MAILRRIVAVTVISRLCGRHAPPRGSMAGRSRSRRLLGIPLVLAMALVLVPGTEALAKPPVTEVSAPPFDGDFSQTVNGGCGEDESLTTHHSYQSFSRAGHISQDFGISEDPTCLISLSMTSGGASEKTKLRASNGQAVELELVYRVNSAEVQTSVGSAQYQFGLQSQLVSKSKRARVDFDVPGAPGTFTDAVGPLEHCTASDASPCDLPSFSPGQHEFAYVGSVHCGRRRCTFRRLDTWSFFDFSDGGDPSELVSEFKADIDILSVSLRLQ